MGFEPFGGVLPGQRQFLPDAAGPAALAHPRLEVALKLLVELLLCILHPIAVILMWINLATRTDIGALAKIAWAIFGIIPLVPFIYVLTGNELF
jgi:NADH:ubiquinone oxidoreductase subunit 3 (subunit A)